MKLHQDAGSGVAKKVQGATAPSNKLCGGVQTELDTEFDRCWWAKEC